MTLLTDKKEIVKIDGQRKIGWKLKSKRLADIQCETQKKCTMC